MSRRPDLRLDAAERRAFLAAALGQDARVPWAAAGTDGYPVIGLAEAHPEGDALRLTGDAPADGASVCVIVERGATYDDITAVVARGRPRAGLLPLEDLVTFSFAKVGPTT